MNAIPTPELLRWPPAPADERWHLLEIETEVLLSANCATSYAYATNASRWVEWHPATRSVEPLPDRPLVLGERIVENISAAGRRFQATWTVIAMDAPRLWVIATDTPQGVARIRYELSPASAADDQALRTRFHRTLEFRSKGWWLRQLDPLVRDWVLAPQSRRALKQLASKLAAG